RPLVISGPSGSGKSTLLTRLFKQYPNTFGFSVSHTTRKPRPGEIDGVNYHYVNEEEFLNLVSANAFIEHAQFSGNRYGTSIKAVRDVMDSGKICVLDIDMQGVKSVKATDLHARFLFIRPPSFEALEQRLRSRNTETEDALKARLEAAKAEMEYAEVPGNHDYILVNDDVELAYQQLKGWILEHYKG
ncbi:guanylate kinase, partial [Paraphysoderma sedebokerense]